MKKARNFWRDLPQGGSRYGSVLTRLFLLLCLLATTQAGWADTEITFSPTASSITTSNVTVSSGNSVPSNLTIENSTQSGWKIDSKPVQIVSTSANITKIVFVGCTNSGSTSGSEVCGDIKTSSDNSTYNTITSGVKITDADQNAQTTGVGFSMVKNGVSTATTVTVEFTNAQQYIQIAKAASNGKQMNIKSIKVYIADAGGDTTPPTLSSSTPANNATGVATSGNITLTFSENVTIKDASKFTLSGGTLGTISASGSTVTIPYSGLSNGTQYTLSTVAGAVQDAANNENAALSDIKFTTAAAGTSATFDFTNTDWDERGGSNGQKTGTQNGITFTITGSGQIRTTVGTSTKFSSGSTFTITSEEGKKITSVVFSQSNSSKRFTPGSTCSVDRTDTTSPYDHIYTLETPANSISFTTSGGNVDVYSITVNYESSTTYAITKPATSNGSFTTTVGGNDVTSAAAGATVTVQAQPNSGYQTSDIVVTKTTGGETVTTSGADNTRTFTMPAEGVTVTATFAEIVKQDVTLAWATSGNKAMTVGETYTNAATATASTDGVLGGGVTYASSDNSVATVSDEGVVTAVGVGSATITASFAATTEYNAATPISYTVTVTNPEVAPTISTQPKAATYTQNATATPLSVTATGNPAPTYQWYSNTANSNTGGTTISGATNATYTPSTATAGTTYYYCVATNSAGSATTNAVAVTVNAATARDASNPAVDVKSDSYGNHTFLDVANTTHNTEANSTNYLTYGAYYLTSLQTKPTWLVDNKRSSSSTSYSYSSATSEGFLTTAGPSSVTSGYGQVQLRQSQGTTFYVTGTTGVAILAKGGSDAGKGVQISINEIAADGTTTAVGSSASDHTNAVAKVEHGSTLSPGKYYEVIVNGESENNVQFYQIRFTQGNAADIVEDPTVVPTDENATFNAANKSVTFTTNEEGGTTYYVVGNDPVENAEAIETTGTSADGATSVNVSTQYSAGQDVVISAVTKKDDKYSNIVYLNLAYNGPVAAQIGNSAAINIQSGNSHTITPFITDANGKRLTFDQDEDASIDYSEYFDFAYAVKDGTTPSQYCSLNTTTGTVNTRDGANNKATTGSTIVVTVTATPKAAALNYVTNVTLTKDITFTVTAEDAGDDITWCDLFWDEACTIPVSQNHGGVTGQAKAKNMVFTDFPNGKVIYVKVNSPATKVCFYYNNSDTSKPTASVTNVDDMTSIKGNNGKTYRYRQCLPIYKNAQGAGLDGEKVWVTLAGYEGEAGQNIGDFINMEFTLAANNNRPLAPTYTPETTSSSSGDMTKMTTTQASTANGDPNGTVMAKYSTNNSYTIIQLVSMPSDNNPRTLNVGKGSVGVFSTVYASNGKMRKTSGVQVVDGVISPMSNVYYSYYPAQKEVNLSFDPEENTVHTAGAHQGEFTKPTLTITAEDPSHVTPITYSIVGEAHGTTINAETGDLTFTNSTPGVVTVKASYAGDEYGSNSYAAAEATYIIYQIDPNKEVVLIKPGSCDFYNEMDVTLEGANKWTGYYTTTESDTEPEFNTTTWTRLDAKQTAMIHLRNTTNVWAYVVNPDNSQNVHGTHQKFTLKTIAKPTLYPDGVTSTYYFHTGELDGGKLKVTAATTQAGASVYYVVDGDDEDLLNGGGTRYDGSAKIQVDGNKTTTIIYAVTRLADGNQSEIVRGVYTKASDVIQPAFKVNADGEEFGSGETMDIATSDKIYLVNKTGNDQAEIYYTVDGSSPTTSSTKYTGASDAFFINKSGTVVKAISVLLGDVSPISTATFNLTSGYNRFWEANSETCDENGKLLDNDGKSGAVISVAKGSPKAVKYITATFGSIYKDSKDDWKHISIGEESKGDPIDGVGTYQIATGYNPQDENGDLYTHMNSSSSLKVHERTFKLPARGAYVRFEPEKDGDLTIWALQQGGVYYTDATEGQEKFLSGFIRKRPVYMIDEQGICQAATDIKAAGTLSDDWNKINRDNLLGKDESQSGVTQTLYTKEQAQTIYDMYDAKIGAASTDNIQDMLIYINDGTHQDAAKAGIGDDTTTGTGIGVCIPSASYMRYTYKVRAGKTYFFFAQRTKLGIRGFRFDPDENAATHNVTLEDEGENSDISTRCDDITDNVTINRTFAANTWTALLLPFSISATQVENTFGKDTRVIHFEKYENYKLYWRNHHYDMIVAGTPVLIYPTQAATISGLKVQIESEEANDPTGDGKYTFNGTYNRGTLNKWDIFVANTGVTKQWTGDDNKPYKSLRAWITGFTSTAKARSTIIGIDGNEEDDVTTGIYEIPFEGTDAGDAFAKGNNNVYSVSGMLIRKNATSLEGLPAGVYIINGKKVVIND